MASQICNICGKTSSVGHNVSHSNRKTKRTWKPNLQRVRIRVGKSLVSAMVCTRCIKGNKIQKAK